jgi:RHS repeat-associated protein
MPLLNYLYDGNGNVISSCDSRGAIVANLAYSRFGEMLSSTDNRSQVTDYLPPFTFSTKPVDVSGLSYYGFRFYNAELGRWLSRDPIKKIGHMNLYVACSNDVILDIIIGNNIKLLESDMRTQNCILT